MFSIGLTSAAYIAASVLFILSLGGLSNQESAKRAVWYGIVGMGVAVFATVFGPGVSNVVLILIAIAAGGYAGYYVAGRVQMTEMPQLVAALHSFVGLAAVFIGLNADMMLSTVVALREGGVSMADADLTGFGEKLWYKDAVEIAILKVEVFLGIFIGAVTFTGSVIAFGKLAGKVDGRLVDASHVVEQDAEVAIVTARDDDALELLRHDLVALDQLRVLLGQKAFQSLKRHERLRLVRAQIKHNLLDTQLTRPPDRHTQFSQLIHCTLMIRTRKTHTVESEDT